MTKVLRLRLTSIPELNYSQAEKDLRLWGRFIRPFMYTHNAFFNRQAQCILPKIMMYGKKEGQPSGYYEASEPIDHYTITQIHRLFHFLPKEDMKAVTVQKYIFEGDEKRKAQRLGMTRHAYRNCLSQVLDFYVEYRNVDFS